MLVFYDLNPQIQKLFETAKFNKFFQITSKKDFERKYLQNFVSGNQAYSMKVDMKSLYPSQ